MSRVSDFLFAPVSVRLGLFHAEGPAVFVFPALVAVGVCVAASLVWLYRDAGRRGKNGWLALLFIVLAGYPLSLVWWLWLRPPGVAVHRAG